MVNKSDNKEESQLLLGRKTVLEALEQNIPIEKLIVSNKLRGEFEIKLRNLATKQNLNIQRVPEVRLDYLSKNQNHQGILAYIGAITYAKLKTILNNKPENGIKILILDGIEDVRNFGAIARSALAFDIDTLVIFSKSSARVNSASIKVSSGALLKLPICRESSIDECYDLLAKNKIPIYASSLNGQSTLNDLDFSNSFALVIGSEGRGISKITQDYADQFFKINQSKKMESLNVSVAAGIILHHAFQKYNIQ